MDEETNKDIISDIRIALGFICLIVAFIGLFWVGEAIYQLWNKPESVAFVSIITDLVQNYSFTFTDGTENGRALHIPGVWAIIIGVFLSIVLISSASILIRTFLLTALVLLFPDVKLDKGLLELLFDFFKQAGNRNK